jgi:heme exporter protein C
VRTLYGKLELLLSVALIAALMLALYGTFLVAPKERTMGNVQRIFYFHVPSAMLAFLGFAVVFVASVGYLKTRNRTWDLLARSSAELGVLFCTIVLVTGPIWAKPIWGAWWTWETRLTLTLLLWLIYMAYLMVRLYVEDPDQQARFAAVLGILGFLVVPFVYFSVYLWGGMHPKNVLRSGGLHPTMRTVFLFNMLAFLLLYVVLLGLRFRLGQARRMLDRLKQRQADL